MKLIRVGPVGQEKPGVLLEQGIRADASSLVSDYTPEFFAEGGLERLRQWVDQAAADAPRFDPGARLGAPVRRPGKLICIGLNYHAHARESGMQVPDEPVVFFKATSAICGPYDDLIIPRGSTKTDWEVELAVVIGRKASYIPEQDAMAHIAGYLLHNDYSERKYQLEGTGQWVKGKSCDTFAPLGPYLATADEIPDPGRLRVWLDLNGRRVQDSNTADLIFPIPEIVSYLSQYMTLEPGDIISTGTPSGVGLGMKPPVYLKPGDVVELGIDGLGTARQVARSWTPAGQRP